MIKAYVIDSVIIIKKPNHKVNKENVNSVMFVPYTAASMLAKRMREAEQNLQEMPGYRLKILEVSGTNNQSGEHPSKG